ncbi:hypothetical protein [Labrenzia sp. R5_0]|jgi:hypothetical protein|uniref:hypothetical protein n=1 Tax=Labrenzia sp. R5_0 TaxID=2821108 RepID=UPI001AD9EFEC|nr:hypothetical protein [Labrenzia sp. R5_0]MBO9459002.1 hypothetical protein [Labrenzia sp. R5_0]
MRHSRKAAPRPRFYARPLAPIKLMRMRLRTFRPDSSTPFYGTNHISRTDFVVFITMPRIDALSEGGQDAR